MRNLKHNKAREISAYKLFTGGASKTAEMAIYFNIACGNMDRLKKEHKDGGHRQLAEYLWKASSNARNKEGYQLTEDDKYIIDGLLKKMDEIRNYHSHIWHDNAALVFDERLRQFIESKYKEATARLYETAPKAVNAYEERNKRINREIILFRKKKTASLT